MSLRSLDHVSVAEIAGWMWSHGYDYGERNNDRELILKNINADNMQATNKLYRWGIKYVLAEGSSRPERIGQTYMNGNVKRVFQRGRYHVYRVKYDGEDY